MVRVGLTGGIASGKSSVSDRLAERGAVVIDYDLLAREVVRPGEAALRRIEQRFGPDVIADDGKLDRAALGAVVFAEESALRDLEAITHPAIHDRAAAVEAEAPAGAIVVHDNPLLIEMGAATDCDVVVVVDVPTSTQIERLVRERGMTEQEARSRMAAQVSREERLASADHVIDNSGSLQDLDLAVDLVWVRLNSGS